MLGRAEKKRKSTALYECGSLDIHLAKGLNQFSA
jgi:hypothetical protein